MIRRILIFTFFAGLALTIIFNQPENTPPVYGLPNFTSISRTPTPAPTSPPAPTPTKKPSNPQPTSPPAATAVPSNTPTATRIPVTLAATPEGGYLPTADACGVPPTVQTRNTVNVRSGPGADYDIVGQMVYLEVRPIIGRAADAEWWVILFANETLGWVANNVVNVQGNISGLPIIGAEPVDGATVTPGAQWNPTRNPACPEIPTNTPEATNTPPPLTSTATIEPEQMAAANTPTKTPTRSASATPTDKPTRETETAVTATSVAPAGEATVAAIASNNENGQPTSLPTAEPLAEPETSSAVASLPCASAVIGLAVIGFLAFRRIF